MKVRRSSIEEVYQITLTRTASNDIRKNSFEEVYQITLPGSASNDITKNFI